LCVRVFVVGWGVEWGVGLWDAGAERRRAERVERAVRVEKRIERVETAGEVARTGEIEKSAVQNWVGIVMVERVAGVGIEEEA
jgi:hypothetical protein